MKKQIIILWIASVVIVFLAVYISNITDKDYPITSTIGIEGKKVSYRFEKTHYGHDDYLIIIRTDIKDLEGQLFWKAQKDSVWQSSKLNKSDLVLEGKIPALKPEKKLDYFVELYYKDKKFVVPDNKSVSITFFGKIPAAINVLEFVLLYLGLILAARTGLEFFNEGRNSKKFGMLTAIIFLTLIALVNPLYLTYKFGFINSSIPPVTRLFLISDLIIFALWVVTLIAIFSTNKYKYLPLIAAILTILITALFR